VSAPLPTSSAPPIGRAAWLLATPITTLLAAIALGGAHARVSLGAAAAITFAGGALTSVVPLGLAARGRLRRHEALVFPLLTGAPVALALLLGRPLPHIFVNFTLVMLAHAVGGAIGSRVVHPGHILPASIVASAADVLSLVHPEGPSHSIAASERALSLLAIHFPVPGVGVMAPVLGLGDLVFLSLVLAVVVRHRLSLLRASALGLAGVFAAGAFSALLEAPVPALIPIAAAITAGLPEARALRPRDRRTTQIAAAIAFSVVVGVLLQRALLPPPAPPAGPANP
jgi:hypothetical protein